MRCSTNIDEVDCRTNACTKHVIAGDEFKIIRGCSKKNVLGGEWGGNNCTKHPSSGEDEPDQLICVCTKDLCNAGTELNVFEYTQTFFSFLFIYLMTQFSEVMKF